jgi:hypothetical protein
MVSALLPSQLQLPPGLVPKSAAAGGLEMTRCLMFLALRQLPAQKRFRMLSEQLNETKSPAVLSENRQGEGSQAPGELE